MMEQGSNDAFSRSWFGDKKFETYSDSDQIELVERALSDGHLITSVQKTRDFLCDITWVELPSGREVEWTCGLVAGTHAIERMKQGG
jgi:hypothetical protein